MKSPCRRMCTLNEDDICLGCGRLLLEITSWTSYNEQQRDNISLACKTRLGELEKTSSHLAGTDSSSI